MKCLALSPILSMALLLGCSDEARKPASESETGSADAGAEQGRSDELEFELFDETHLLSDEDLALLSALDESTLHFDGVPSGLAEVQAMDVVLGGVSPNSPRGFMRLVLDVDESDDGLTLTTIDAPLPLAFRRLHVRATRDLPGGETNPKPVGRFGQQTQPLTFGQDAIMTWPIDAPLYDVDHDEQTLYDQVTGQGQLRAGIRYTFGIDSDWADFEGSLGKAKKCIADAFTLNFNGCNPLDVLPEVAASMDMEVLAEADLALQGVAFLGYSSDYPLYEEALPEIPVGPFLFIPHLEIEARYSGSASSQFNWEVGAHFEASAGLSVSTKDPVVHVDIPNPDIGFSHGDVDAVLQAEGSLEIGPRLSILLYDVAGPTAGLFLGAKLEANADESPCWVLTGTTTGTLGIYLGLKELDFALVDEERNFGLGEQEIATGECSPAPEGAEAPPVGGPPSNSAFQDPVFTPWALAHASTVDYTPQEGPGAQIEWSQLTPSIDGRLWLTGSDVKVLDSIDSDGSLAWSKRYVADVPYWQDTNIPDLLLTRAVPTTDAAMMVLAHPYTLMKLDPAGDLFFAKRFLVPAYAETRLRFTDMVPDGHGGFYVGGTLGEDATKTNVHDAWLLRVDRRANVLWSRRIGDAEWSEDIRVLIPVDGGVVAAGARYNDDGARWHAPLFGFDEQGNLLWAKELVASDCDFETEERLWITTGLTSIDGDLVFGATVQNGFVGYEGLVFKVKPSTGAVPWSQGLRTDLPSALGPQLSALVQLPTSGFLAAGTLDAEQASQDWWLAGLDAAGQVQWMNRLGGDENQDDALRRQDNYPSLQLMQDGAVVVAGYTETFVDNGTWVVKAPARDGVIDLDADIGAVVDALPYVIDGSCIAVEDVDIPVADEPAPELEPLAVTVENVDTTQRRLTP
jgi:hypothetical protein